MKIKVINKIREAIKLALQDDASLNVNVLLAIAMVESRGVFVKKNGTIPMLFERHVFYRRIAKKYGKEVAEKHFEENPNICNPKSGGYGRFKEQPVRHAKASVIDLEVACDSTSWGAYQLMGFNFDACGYEDSLDMVNNMHSNYVEHQTEAFINFVLSNKRLVKAIKAKDWAKIARNYNGKAYAKNKYDIKLKKTYTKIKGLI